MYCTYTVLYRFNYASPCFLSPSSLAFPLCRIFFLWLVPGELTVVVLRPLYRPFVRMCYYALTYAFHLHSSSVPLRFSATNSPLFTTSSLLVSRYFSFTITQSSFMSSSTLAVCFLSWVLSCVLNASRLLLGVFPVRSLCVLLRFPWVPKSVLSCIPSFPVGYLSFTLPIRSVSFSVSSVLCSVAFRYTQPFRFINSPCVSFRFSYVPSCGPRAFWNPYILPWVPNGFALIPEQ